MVGFWFIHLVFDGSRGWSHAPGVSIDSYAAQPTCFHALLTGMYEHWYTLCIVYFFQFVVIICFNVLDRA